MGLQAAERDYVSGAEQIVSKLKKQVSPWHTPVLHCAAVYSSVLQ